MEATGVMQVGDVAVHDGFTMHRAGTNATAAPREAYAMHYFSDGARMLDPDTPARRRLHDYFAPDLAPGDRAATGLWRVVYPELEEVDPRTIPQLGPPEERLSSSSGPTARRG